MKGKNYFDNIRAVVPPIVPVEDENDKKVAASDKWVAWNPVSEPLARHKELQTIDNGGLVDLPIKKFKKQKKSKVKDVEVPKFSGRNHLLN